jgi:hypothetical protein
MEKTQENTVQAGEYGGSLIGHKRWFDSTRPYKMVAAGPGHDNCDTRKGMAEIARKGATPLKASLDP